MKKFILTGATLMAFATASFAQNTTTTNQVGTSQKAQVEQYGNLQKSNIQQITGTATGGNANYGNYAGTFQSSATGANEATINQADGSQGNRAAASQSGADHKSTINQNGGNDGISGGATTTPATLGSEGQEGNFAGTLQQGTLSEAFINQNNASKQNDAAIWQNSAGTDKNTGTIDQSNTSTNNSAAIYQGFTGAGQAGDAVSKNTAIINQQNTSTGNEASITQLANGNTGHC